MNYASFVGKIIEKPEQSFFKNNVSVTEIVVNFFQIRKNNSDIKLRISIWESLDNKLKKSYQLNDLIIIEGYISLRDSVFQNLNKIQDKEVEISSFKVYRLNFSKKNF
jgi:single-stranded DNA-binding protein